MHFVIKNDTTKGENAILREYGRRPETATKDEREKAREIVRATAEAIRRGK